MLTSINDSKRGFTGSWSDFYKDAVSFLNLLLSPNKLLVFRMVLTDWQFSGLSSDFQIHQVIGLKQKRNRFYFKVQT